MAVYCVHAAVQQRQDGLDDQMEDKLDEPVQLKQDSLPKVGIRHKTVGYKQLQINIFLLTSEHTFT